MVAAIGLVGLLVLVAAISVGTVAIVLDHRRAQVAADLGALAGAAELRRGGDACHRAAQIVARHHVAVTDCAVEGATVLVTTSVSLPSALGGHRLQARARAGPAAPSGAGPASSAMPAALP